MTIRRQDCNSDADYERIRRFDESDLMEGEMSDIQRWEIGYNGDWSALERRKCDEGKFVLHADHLKIVKKELELKVCRWTLEHDCWRPGCNSDDYYIIEATYCPACGGKIEVV